MTMLKDIQIVDSKLLTWSKDDRSFCCFESDNIIKPSRIYDDACDFGFFVKSHKTGKKILFVGGAPKYNSDSEIVSFEFSAHCLHENPEYLFDLKVVVYND